jgi:hypothetical protein
MAETNNTSTILTRQPFSRIFGFIKQLQFSWRSLPVILLLLNILAYGLHLSWMGFYWDDWPWIWSSHVMGTDGMFTIDSIQRPLSGAVLYLGALLAGENPLGWQIYNFILRLLAGVSLAWALKVLWPRNQKQIIWVVLLFLVYPGFSQQFVSVNNSRHLLPFTTLFLSLGFMVEANRKQKRYLLFTGISVLFSIITMLTTEYYYGLELIRPVILWIVVREREKKPAVKLLTIFKAWLPYLIPLVGIFAWRYTISKSVNYSVTLFNDLSSSPKQSALELLSSAADDILSAGIGVWGKAMRPPSPMLFGSRARLYYWGLVGITAGGSFLYLIFFRPDPPEEKRWGIEAILLGGFSLIVSAVPFWLTGLDIKIFFPFDRLTLPLMLGSSLFLVAVIDLLIQNRFIKIGLIALLIGFSVGVQYQNGITYRRDWRHQTDFIQQLAWRIPGLQQGTVFLANQLPTTYSTDNSLTAPVNWLFAPDFSGGEIPTFLFYIELRFGTPDRSFGEDTQFDYKYRFYELNSDPSQVLVIYNQPPACLRILDPAYHQDFPSLPPMVKSALPFSNLEQIQITPGMTATLPPPFEPILEPSWCYYFQKADLARQRGEWQTVAAFADAAFDLGYPDSPVKHVNEYELFIEGYAHIDQWKKAEERTLEAIKFDPLLENMLCETWARIESDTEASAEREPILERINRIMNCNIYEPFH